MKKIYLSILFVFFVCTDIFAQMGEIGGFLGTSYYMGDINPNKQFFQSQIAEGFFVKYNFDSRLAAKFSFYKGKLKSDDQIVKHNERRKLKFQTPINEVSLQFEFNFFKYYIGSNLNYFVPYIFGGVSCFTFKPEADGYDLRALGTEGQNLSGDKYSLTGVSIPFGVGVKYSLSKRFGLGLEWGLRKTFTDYIDDVSKTYYLDAIDAGIPKEYYSDPSMTFEPGTQRGNSKNNDWYSFAGISISYKINLRGNKGCRDYPKHYKK